jgi:hypothetical protein
MYFDYSFIVSRYANTLGSVQITASTTSFSVLLSHQLKYLSSIFFVTFTNFHLYLTIVSTSLIERFSDLYISFRCIAHHAYLVLRCSKLIFSHIHLEYLKDTPSRFVNHSNLSHMNRELHLLMYIESFGSHSQLNS